MATKQILIGFSVYLLTLLFTTGLAIDFSGSLGFIIRFFLLGISLIGVTIAALLFGLNLTLFQLAVFIMVLFLSVQLTSSIIAYKYG